MGDILRIFKSLQRKTKKRDPLRHLPSFYVLKKMDHVFALRLFGCVANPQYITSLAWPDPLRTGAYQLEIISAALIISNQ